MAPQSSDQQNRFFLTMTVLTERSTEVKCEYTFIITCEWKSGSSTVKQYARAGQVTKFIQLMFLNSSESIMLSKLEFSNCNSLYFSAKYIVIRYNF